MDRASVLAILFTKAAGGLGYAEHTFVETL
jgi:hypothetical protein